jgi:hypothetical protein
MAKLTKEERDALPDEMFAVPGKRKLPMRDEDHVRLGWDMVDRTQGLTSDERRIARERLKHRAGELGINTSDWHITACVAFEAMALAMPDVADHPNRMPFRGVLTRIDQPSDAPPGGSGGYRTLIPKAVAEKALPSLLGMALDYTPDFDGHDRRQKIGLITGAEIVGDAIEIEGFFYAKDFPEECEQIRAEKDALGFSFECDARIQDVSADIWEISHCVFTGAAVLYKHLAAYTTTSLAAKAEQELEMTKEELLAIFAEANKPLTEAVATLTDKVNQIEAKGASLAGPIIDQVKPHVDALNAAADAMEKSGVGNDGKAGHAGVVRKIAAHMAAEAVSGRVPMIYRDHDYLPDARVEAGADKKVVEDAVAAAVKPIQEALEAAQTQVKDLQAKAFNTSEAPQRQTFSPEVKSLLAKAGIGEDAVADGKKLSVEQVDKMLEAAGINGRQAITAKLKLMHEGVINAQ